MASHHSLPPSRRRPPSIPPTPLPFHFPSCCLSSPNCINLPNTGYIRRDNNKLANKSLELLAKWHWRHTKIIWDYLWVELWNETPCWASIPSFPQSFCTVGCERNFLLKSFRLNWRLLLEEGLDAFSCLPHFSVPSFGPSPLLDPRTQVVLACGQIHKDETHQKIYCVASLLMNASPAFPTVTKHGDMIYSFIFYHYIIFYCQGYTIIIWNVTCRLSFGFYSIVTPFSSFPSAFSAPLHPMLLYNIITRRVREGRGEEKQSTLSLSRSLGHRVDLWTIFTFRHSQM